MDRNLIKKNKTMKKLLTILLLLVITTVSSQNYGYFMLGAEVNGVSGYHTDVYFNTNASDGLDPGYDAVAFNGVGSSTPKIYTELVDGSSNGTFQIQSLHPDALETNVEIPIGINLPKDTPMTISTTENTLPEGISIILNDYETGDEITLNGTSYMFSSENDLSGTGRFTISFNNTLGTEDKELTAKNWKLVRTYNLTGQLGVNSSKQLILSVYTDGTNYITKKRIINYE